MRVSAVLPGSMSSGASAIVGGLAVTGAAARVSALAGVLVAGRTAGKPDIRSTSASGAHFSEIKS